MTFWQENYAFVKDVYDTRYSKMVEWMDSIEVAIQRVCADRAYTSSEFKREKEIFNSLCKTLEKSDTNGWLRETLDALTRDHPGEEERRQEELRRLAAAADRHRALLPRVAETERRCECYWQCYSYGDQLMPILELIESLRVASAREVHSGSQEQTEEHIERQDKTISLLDNKKKMVMEFVARGEELLSDPNCPKFLSGHLGKLTSAWEAASTLAQSKRQELSANLAAWDVLDAANAECHERLDEADDACAQIARRFDLQGGERDLSERSEAAQNSKRNIMQLFQDVSKSNDCLQQMITRDKKDDLIKMVSKLEKRLSVLERTSKKLSDLSEFYRRLRELDEGLAEVEGWIDEARVELSGLADAAAQSGCSPEDRVTRAMEIRDDLMMKSEVLQMQEEERQEILPKEGEEMPDAAQTFVDRIEKSRRELDALVDKANEECGKCSEDVKLWAEFRAGVRRFQPWLEAAEERCAGGSGGRQQERKSPHSLEEASAQLAEDKVFQEECDLWLKLLEDAGAAAAKMTINQDAKDQIRQLRVDASSKERVARMSVLVGCWNELDGRVDLLNSWVHEDGSLRDPDDGAAISMEKLEEQLGQLKAKFQEKQHLVVDLAEFTKRAKEVGEALTASRREAASEAAARNRDPLQDEIEEVVASSRS